MSMYSFVKSNVNLDQLSVSIRGSSITVALDYMNLNGTALDIYFKADLSSGEQTTLSTLVTNHVPVAVVETPQQVSVTETPPFAKPDYRTKRDATANWITCPENAPTVIDFQLTEERYVTGGEIIFKNAKEGDYITAEVYDTDSIIPEPYRALLCEEWPSIAKYIPKKWLKPTATDGYDSFMIDTYPLNAKISAGLFLRITYHATSETGNRKCAVNYHLTKKLV